MTIGPLRIGKPAAQQSETMASAASGDAGAMAAEVVQRYGAGLLIGF
jgi:hypothetical protein